MYNINDLLIDLSHNIVRECKESNNDEEAAAEVKHRIKRMLTMLKTQELDIEDLEG